MRRLKIISALVLLFIAGSANYARGQQPTGRLQGIVVDWQFARILRTKMSFSNRQIKKEITVDDNGAYSIELPAGTYWIKASAAGFDIRWVRYSIEADKSHVFNLRLDVAANTSWVRCPRNSLCL